MFFSINFLVMILLIFFMFNSGLFYNLFSDVILLCFSVVYIITQLYFLSVSFFGILFGLLYLSSFMFLFLFSLILINMPFFIEQNLLLVGLFFCFSNFFVLFFNNTSAFLFMSYNFMIYFLLIIFLMMVIFLTIKMYML